MSTPSNKTKLSFEEVYKYLHSLGEYVKGNLFEDLSSHFFEGRSFVFSFIISKAKNIGRNFKNTIDNQTPSYHSLLYGDLIDAGLDWSVR